MTQCDAENWNRQLCEGELGHYSDQMGKPRMGGSPHFRDAGEGRYLRWFDQHDNCKPDSIKQQAKDYFKTRKQVGGDHYQGASMQPFDVIDAFELDFYEGSAVKYLLRWRKKNGIEDLEKAKHYIEILIKKAEQSDN